MSAVCFVCNLPILSHQVGLVWKGGNGADEYAAAQSIPIRRRDSSSQISTFEPPSPPGRTRRRRSSLAQLTDLIRDWGRGEKKRGDLSRRETLADLARALPFGRRDSDTREPPRPKPARRRQSLADFHLRTKRRLEQNVDMKTDLSKLLAGRENVTELWRKRREEQVHSEREERRSRRESSSPSGRREHKPALSPDGKYIEPRALIEARQAALMRQQEEQARDSGVTVSASNVSDDRQSPTPPAPSSMVHRISLPTITPLAPVRPRPCISPEPHLSSRSREHSPQLGRLRRQATAFEEGSPTPAGRRGSRPFLSPDPAEPELSLRTRRRDSLSPDSAAEEMNVARRQQRRDSRPHLTPEDELKARRQSSEEPACRGRRTSRHGLHSERRQAGYSGSTHNNTMDGTAAHGSD